MAIRSIIAANSAVFLKYLRGHKNLYPIHCHLVCFQFQDQTWLRSKPVNTFCYPHGVDIPVESKNSLCSETRPRELYEFAY